ncbi:hypothetical protein BH20VER2_BH20VER2_18020 [soil metagenome]
MTALLIGRDAGGDLRAIEIGGEPHNIEAESLGKSGEVRASIRLGAPDGPMLVDEVVHFPELSLHSGCFRGAGGEAGVLVAIEREVPEDDTEAAAILFLQLVENGGDRATGWALEVGKLFDYHLAPAADVRRHRTGFGAGSKVENFRGGLGPGRFSDFRAVEESSGDTGTDCYSDDKDEGEMALLKHGDKPGCVPAFRRIRERAQAPRGGAVQVRSIRLQDGKRRVTSGGTKRLRWITYGS